MHLDEQSKSTERLFDKIWFEWPGLLVHKSYVFRALGSSLNWIGSPSEQVNALSKAVMKVYFGPAADQCITEDQLGLSWDLG